MNDLGGKRRENCGKCRPEKRERPFDEAIADSCRNNRRNGRNSVGEDNTRLSGVAFDGPRAFENNPSERIEGAAEIRAYVLTRLCRYVRYTCQRNTQRGVKWRPRPFSLNSQAPAKLDYSDRRCVAAGQN